MRRRSRKKLRKPDYLCIIVLSLLTAIFLAGGFFFWCDSFAPETALVLAQGPSIGQAKSSFFFGTLASGRDLLGAGVPGFARSLPKPSTEAEKNHFSPTKGLRSALLLFTDIDTEDIRSILQREIPLLAGLTHSEVATLSANSTETLPKFEFSLSGKEGKPLVGIYHTHTSESFIPSSGSSHSAGGQKGDIVQVGAALSKRLENRGVGVVQSSAVHDYPSFMKAYNLSEITLQRMLNDHPSLQMVFDIHRDAQKRENVTTTIQGVPTARILIIVAVGRPDLVQPHWQQNHAFAKQIEAKLNKEYPGLCRGIKLEDWRYNQHLHPRALLLEVGSEESSLEEASRSMEILGDVLADLIEAGAKP
ncbi:MAG: stage II sporulation protein P [Sporomusaceae bacterium]|nr:stage II sporulation protein P [Sporomusaceae bacterium]